MQEAADADNKAKEEEEDAQETVGAFNGVYCNILTASWPTSVTTTCTNTCAWACRMCSTRRMCVCHGRHEH